MCSSGSAATGFFVMLHLPQGLPTIEGLRRELVAATGVPVADALHIGLVNLMPNKAATERQFARHLAVHRRSIRLSFFRMAVHESRHTDAEYLDRFYEPLTRDAIDDLDGIIVTGAPVEHLPFSAVDYWHDLTGALDRVRQRRLPALYVCWAAQAALYHHHGIDKVALPQKAFGVETLDVIAPDQPLASGLAPTFSVPVSRHTAVRVDDILVHRQLTPIAVSDLSGAVLVSEPAVNAVYMSNHFEYDADTLAREYERDRAAGHAIALPFDYFPDDDPRRPAMARWQPAARRFFTNWVGLVAGYAEAPAAHSAA